jgi:hypothetical protein
MGLRKVGTLQFKRRMTETVRLYGREVDRYVGKR